MTLPLIGVEGTRFGYLLALREVDRGARKGRHFLCRCDCGAETEVNLDHLRSRHTKSCGCFHREATSESHRRHGESHGRSLTPEYRAWKEMIKRCENQKCERYPIYGGRGIRVCDEWRHSYELFLAAVGRRPSTYHSLHRINNDGPYAPGNVQWQTKVHQARHTRRNVIIEINGQSRCLAEWCDVLNLSRGTIYARIANGWDPKRALSEPINFRRIRI